jgi:hypothetical protein
MLKRIRPLLCAKRPRQEDFQDLCPFPVYGFRSYTFYLYRKDLLQHITATQYPVLVVTVDVPAFGFRSRDIRNGLGADAVAALGNKGGVHTINSLTLQ